MATPSRTFIVRVWLEAGGLEPASPDVPGPWRASATDASSQERRFFSSPGSLVAFLQTSAGLRTSKAASADDPGPEWPLSLEDL